MPKMSELITESQRALNQKPEGAAGDFDQGTFTIDDQSRSRPWHGLDFDNSSARDFIEDWRKNSEVKPPDLIKSNALPWYATVDGILRALVTRRVTLSLSFVTTLTAASLLASTIPSSYSSNLNLYAPEKTDSISSRLQLFSNRIDFASFPVDFKIPLGLIARRLSSETSRAWVLKRYADLHHQSLSPLIPDFVRAETFYAEGSEILVILGYANDAQIAVEITNLYWECLEYEIQRLRDENLLKVRHWVELTSSDWRQQLATISQNLSRFTRARSNVSAATTDTQVNVELTAAESKRRQIESEIGNLRTALQSDDHDAIWNVSETDIQDLRRVDEAIQSQISQMSSAQNDGAASHHRELTQKARQIGEKHLREKEFEFRSVQETQSRLSKILSRHFETVKSADQSELKFNELTRQQSEFSSRLDELEKLKNQIDVESSLSHNKLRAIQAATADPSSRRPSLILKYSLATFAAVVASILMLILVESSFAYRLRRAAT